MTIEPIDPSEELVLSSFITYTNSVVKEEDSPRIRARNAKYLLLEVMKSYTSLLGINSCSNQVRIWNPSNVDGERIIRKSCNNRHACPVCTSKYMASSRELIARLMKEQRAKGGEIFQSVLNQTIKPQDKLQVTLPRLNKAWADMTATVAWRKLASKYGLEGYIRLQEQAYRKDTWFPHFHVIWAFKEHFDYNHMLTFALEVADLWATYSQNAGALGTTASNQLHDTIDEGSEKSQANYFTKHGYFDLEFDPESVDLNKHSLTPFQLLIYAFYIADADLMDQWEDFEQGTQQTRRVVLSTAMKALANSLDD